MKHLKRFNEDKFSLKNEDIEDELRELCNDYLSYLIDSGFYINIFSANDTYITISKKENNSITHPIFSWLDVKDDIIPFIEILKSNYKIDNDSICLSGYQPAKLTQYSKNFYINELEEIPDNDTCKYITIKIITK